MNRLLPPDIAEREKIEKILDKNFLVEAGAGSGKTSSLVKRMVSIIRGGNILVQEIAAITFTRKAAAELKERFQNQLEKAFREEKDALLKTRLEQALFDLDQCFLGTIHSFCARLLRERPIEAGLDPDFKELEEVQNRLLIEKAWEDYLIEVKVNKPRLLEKLNELGIDIKDVKPSFVRLSDFPDLEIVAEQASEPDLTPAFQKLEVLIDKAYLAIPARPPERGYDDLQKAIFKARRYIRYFDLSQKANMFKVLALFSKEKKVTQNRWTSTAEAKEYRDEFIELTNNVISPVVTLWLENCHYDIMAFILPGVKYFENMRRELSMLNFQDLLMKTAKMLRDNPEVREYFQNKYKCLLIDEFQDTDPIQSEVMFYLTGSDTQEKNWFRLVPKPGTLFVVGDPKQSIYRFRRADIDTYNTVKDLILKNGGEVLKLTANFRSLKDLGEWFNPTFQKLFPIDASSYQAEFSSMDTIRSSEKGTMSGIKIIDIPEVLTKKEEIVVADAKYIARYIKLGLEGNFTLARSEEEKQAGVRQIPQPKDFMILLRYKDSMDTYARALEYYGIPVKITGGSSLKDSKEIIELLRLLKALNDTDNSVALVAVLRGLFFGISDDELYRFKTQGGYFNIFSTIPEGLDGEIANKFAEAYETLKKYHGWTQRYSPIVALEKIINDLGIVPYILSGEMGKSRCSYVFQIIESLRKSEMDTAYSFNLMVEQFIAVMEADFEEELNILPDEENAVRLMNLHKAKGLEAPVIFLAHPYKSVTWPPEEHVKRLDDIPKGYFSFYRSKGFQKEVIGQPQNWDEYAHEESKYQEAEELRLLYVAATRAKNMLVISRSLKDKELKKNPWSILLEEALDKDVLEIPEESRLVVDRVVGINDVTKEVFEKAEQAFHTDVSMLAVPSYKVTSPTGLKGGDDLPQVKRLSGGGMDWGTAIHKLLEEVVKGTRDLDILISRVLTENNLPLERKEEAEQVVKEFKNSSLWQRLQQAKSIYSEVPFTLKIEDNNHLYKIVGESDGKPVILNGVIDLVFEELDGWVVVDFKTDRPENEEDFVTLENVYSNQVRIYCHVWEKISGFKVKSGELFFTSLNQTNEIFET